VFGPKNEVLKQITGDNVQPIRTPGS
jgi:hypothetical protein